MNRQAAGRTATLVLLASPVLAAGCSPAPPPLPEAPPEAPPAASPAASPAAPPAASTAAPAAPAGSSEPAPAPAGSSDGLPAPVGSSAPDVPPAPSADAGGSQPKSLGSGAGEFGGGNEGSKQPKIRAGSWAISGGLPPAVITRIIRQNFGRFRLCYENGLRNNPNLQGRVSVRFVIGRDGRVSQVGGGGDLPDGGVINCVTRAFYGLTFPQPEGGVVTVGYPIVFSPGGR